MSEEEKARWIEQKNADFRALGEEFYPEIAMSWIACPIHGRQRGNIAGSWGWDKPEPCRVEGCKEMAVLEQDAE